MHFGLTTAAFGDFADPRTLASLAHEAEDIGWDGFFIWDHVATAGSYGAPRSGVDPLFDTWVALTAIAMSADRIPLGPRVTPLPRRRSWKVARETVSLDHRLFHLILLASEVERFAAPQHLGGGSVASKAPFRRVARWDGVCPFRATVPMSPDDVRAALAYIRQYRASSAPFDVSLGSTTPGDDRAQAADIVAPYIEAGLTWWIEDIGPARGSVDEMRELVNSCERPQPQEGRPCRHRKSPRCSSPRKPKPSRGAS
jgi:hypothetical protein